MLSFPICNYIKCNFLSFVNMMPTLLAPFSLIPLIFELWLFITIHKLWRASTFLDHGWLTNCCNIYSFFWPGVDKKHEKQWSIRAPPYACSFALCVRSSRRERHSQRQKTSRGRYWLLHLLLTPSIHAAQYAQIQHIPIEHFCFAASWSPLLAQSEPEVTLCCSQKTLFREHFVNICEKRCTQKWCILIYGSLKTCFDQPLILTQSLIQYGSGANGDLQWPLSEHLKV